MPPLPYLNPTKLLLLYLIFFLFTSTILFASSESQFQTKKFLTRRRLVDIEDKETHPTKKIPTTINFPAKKPSTKNETKIKKPTNSPPKPNLTKSDLKKLNSTSKPSNSSKHNPILTKQISPKKKALILQNQNNQATNKKQTQHGEANLLTDLPSKSQKTLFLPNQNNQPTDNEQTQQNPLNPQNGDDLLTEFTDLPKNFQKTLIPDLELFSTKSKTYLTNGIKTIIGNKYASTIASIISIAIIILPLIFISLIFHRIKAYFSLQKLLIFINLYLSIYFSILCFAALITGVEPLRLFYATSEYTYIWLQVLQTLGYVMYLLLLCMYLVLVFSTNCGLGLKFLGLAQTFVGLVIGLHSYVSVFHRVVLHHPPKSSWKIHGMYATCYLVICLFSTADRRKKAYLEDGGEEGKKN